MGLRTLSVIIAIGIICLNLSSLHAEASQEKFKAKTLIDEVTVIADYLTYDENLGLVLASGNVELSQAGRLLLADTIAYSETKGLMAANGNVTLLEPSGEVIFANRIVLSDEMKSGFVGDPKLKLDAQTRIAANSAVRTDGNTTKMSRGIFSPCELCTENPARSPLWQIKAVNIVHDQKQQDLHYYDAWLELFGIPIIYTPYFEHPDPTVKRRSGFLAPEYGSSSNLGLQLSVPYYWDLAPNRDITVKPRLTTKEGAVWAAEYRERTYTGEYTVDGSITYGEERDSSGNKTGKHGPRGHLFSHGQYEYNKIWNYGYNLEGASDDTYLSFFGISSKDTLTSKTYVEGINGRNFASAYTYIFQNLEAGNNQDEVPIILPLLDYRHVSVPGRNGSFTTLNANLLGLHRIDGADSRRLSLQGGWHLPYIGQSGSIYKLSATLRGDGYHVNNVTLENIQTTTKARGLVGRIRPEIIAEWRLPMIKANGNVKQLIEPIFQGIISPYGGNPGEIPNEDSQDFEFDDTKLFSNNRFTGLDRVESGPRVNYGIRFGFFGSNVGRTQGMIGQSARLKKDDTFNAGSGLEDKLSDYVGRINIAPSDIFNLAYRFRLAREDFSARRNEIDLATGPEYLRATLGYTMLEEQVPGSDATAFANREEIITAIQAKLATFWTIGGGTRLDLGGSGGTINWNGSLTYEDECLLFGTQLNKNFTRDRDIKPDTSLLFSIKFKHLG